MAKRKLKRCKECKQLVSDVDNCGYCAAKAKGLITGNTVGSSSRKPSLDRTEGNSEENF